ncbi:cell envelope integrity protein TolA [Vibrio parahaemolyticus]|uniref:cell envelope integrity protein TolA n=1 Tax=Vibrio parahaemolyticus TaxID=670 RepID=UPI0011207CE6|nr:cell envelope integrity protein TolA [Vibrio parahaemolyticus]TOP89924.1 hypothetical protein CGH07_16690 [Vibrio parahaemolyticus]
MPTFVSIESPKLGSAVQLNNQENTTVVSVENSTFGSVVEVNKQENVNVYHLENTDIQSYYNEISRQHAEAAQAAQSGAELAESGAQTAETNAKASELDAEAAQVAAETAQANAEAAEAGSIAARNAAQTAQSLSETAQAGAELAETNAKLSELDAEAAQLAAEAAQSGAQTAEAGSIAARNAAQTAQSQSETARNQSQAAQAAAELAETNAKASELDAEAAQLAAETARDQSQAAQAAAELAESGAQTAEANAEFAQAGAETAQANAEVAESGAISARDDSVNAKLASEAARDAAQAAQSGAQTAEASAQASASDANAAKVAAQTAQANSETAQSAAETAEANAQASASSAATSAQSASDDAARAEAAANTAVNTLSAKGDWDASTGVYPTPTPNSADFYQISVAGTMTGTQGSMQANIGDQLYWNVDKAIWYKIDNTDHILSVNGQEGTVVLDHTDVGALGATQNAVSASKWQTARTLTLAGDATGAVSIDGSSNATLTVAVANDSHTHDGRYYTETEADARFAPKAVGGYVKSAGGTMTGYLNVPTTQAQSSNVVYGFGGTSGGKIGSMQLSSGDIDDYQRSGFIDVNSSITGKPAEETGWMWGVHTEHNNGNGYAMTLAMGQNSNRLWWKRRESGVSSAWMKIFDDEYHPLADKWTTARTLTIGESSKPLDGSSNVSWSLAEIGAAADTGDSTKSFDAYSINLTNVEKADLDTDGELGFDSSQGLLVRRAQQGIVGTVTVLDGANVKAGVGMSISNLLAGGTGTESFTFNVTDAPKWTNARTLTIGNTGKSVDGSSNTSWSLAEIGAVSKAGDTINGQLTIRHTNVQLNLMDSTYSDNYWQLDHQNGVMAFRYNGSASDDFRLNENGTAVFAHSVTAPTFVGSLSGNASTASKWATARNLTVGNSTKSIDGGSNVSFSHDEIDVARWKKETINLGGYSTSNWFAIYFRSGASSVHQRVNFYINGGSGSGADPYTQTFLIGSAQASGWSALRPGFELGYYPYEPSKSTIHSIWRGTQNLQGFVVYVRGGFSYQIAHDGAATVYTSTVNLSGAEFPSNVSNPASGGTNRSVMRTLLNATRGMHYGTPIVASLEGNADTASKWLDTRTITLSGDASGSVSIDGSGNVTLPVTIANDSHTHDGRYYTESESNSRFAQNSEFASAGTYAGIVNKYLGKVSSAGVLEIARYIDFHTTNSTADYDIRLDCNSSGNLSVVGGTLTGSFVGPLSGNASTATWADTVDVNTSTSTSFYGLVWHSGDTLYASENQGLTVRPSDGFTKIKHGYLGNTRVAHDTTGRIKPSSTSYRRAGMYGIYDSTKVGHIWSMGEAYMIPDNGANFGNLYGLAYKHTNNTTGGTMAGSHQMVWCENGTPKSAMGQNIWTSGKVIASSVSASPITSSNTANSYSIASQGAGVYAVLWSQTGYSNYSTILIWDGSKATLNGDYGNGLVPAINTSGAIYSAASTNWIPKRVVKIG